MIPSRLATVGRSRALLSVLFGSLLCLSSSSMAFEQLTPAQTLIYDTAHLANTTPGQTVSYRYEFSDDAGAEVQDEVLMSISASEKQGRRDVELTFLSEERHIPMPPFTEYRGNPVIIGMLEHLAQSLGAATGGGTLYFRNRIRDALAEKDLDIMPGTAEHDGSEVATQSISFYPFTDDTIMAADSPFRQAEITLSFSDQVPAGVLAIRMQAESGDQHIDRRLQLSGVQ